MNWLQRKSADTKKKVDAAGALAMTQDFMELNDPVRLQAQGARLVKALDDVVEELTVYSLQELVNSTRYITCRQNIVEVDGDGTIRLHRGLHADSESNTVLLRPEASHTLKNGMALEYPTVQPPKNRKDAYRVRFALTTPQLTTAVRNAGKSTAVSEVVIEVNPGWAPIGAARFRLLVEQQYFVGCRFFCVVPTFVAQVGLHFDPRTGEKWLQMPIADDPLIEANKKGRVSFISLGPHTRTAQIFFNLGDNSMAGDQAETSLDAQGFVPFGEVVEGMEVVENINSEYGGEPEVPMIIKYGQRYLERNFPNLTTITACGFEPLPAERLVVASLQRLACSKLLLVPTFIVVSENLLAKIADFGTNVTEQFVVDRHMDQNPANDVSLLVDASTSPTTSTTSAAMAADIQENLDLQLDELNDLDIPAEELLGELAQLGIPLQN